MTFTYKKKCLLWREYDQPLPQKIFQTVSQEQIRCVYIMQTCPYNEHPLTPHLYVAKLGFTRVDIIFLFLL